MRDMKGKNNPMFGKPRPDLVLYNQSEKHRVRVSQAMQGEHNPMWKGDNVGYTPLHQWVHRHLPKSELCQHCNKIKPYDLANVTGKYQRNLTNWQWLCRSCHMKSDGRLNNLVAGRNSSTAKKGWSKFSKEERSARIKKGWITRRKNQ